MSIIISDLFNSSISSGIFPECFKLAGIIPIFKAKDRSLVINYRPISLTHLISKLFEKLMTKRMNNFISRHNILSEHQFGFRSGLSISDAVLRFVDECATALDDKKFLVAVFLDLSKAFDTVNYRILLSSVV